MIRRGLRRRGVTTGMIRRGLRRRDVTTGMIRRGLRRRDVTTGMIRRGLRRRDVTTGMIRRGLRRSTRRTTVRVSSQLLIVLAPELAQRLLIRHDLPRAWIFNAHCPSFTTLDPGIHGVPESIRISPLLYKQLPEGSLVLHIMAAKYFPPPLCHLPLLLLLGGP